MRRSKVLEKLKSNKPVIVVGASFTSSSRITEIAGTIGFDCLWIDMEHRPIDYQDVFQLIQGARAVDTDCVVRIRKDCDANYFRILEDGASGIMIPHCRSAEEAEYVIRNCKYPPIGKRGIDGVGPDSDYGLSGGKEYLEHANRETFVVVQIEDKEAVECVEEIAAVKGIDILFVGPADLTGSYGIAGDIKNPVIVDAIDRVAKAALDNGKCWGIPAGSPKMAQEYIDKGARFINSGSDRSVLVKGLKNLWESYSALIIDSQK